MIIRLSTPSRQIRVITEPSDILNTIITTKLSITKYTASMTPSLDVPLDSSLSLDKLGVKNGATVYISDDASFEPVNQINKPNESYIINSNESNNTNKSTNVKSISCTHEQNAMCSNCAPLNPWDPSYLSQQGIKYLSHRSHAAMYKREKVLLEPLSYAEIVCDRHGPNASCMHCQKRDIILMPQTYRMVDHVEIENRAVIDYFVSFWRGSGRQRIGFLVGTEGDYEKTPLGRKVKVSWVYEIGQENFPDGFVVEQDLIDILFNDKNNDTNKKKHTNHSNNNSNNKTNNKNNNKVINEDDIKELNKKVNTDTSSEIYSENSTNSDIINLSTDNLKHVNIYRDDRKSVESLKHLLTLFQMKIVGVIFTDMTEPKREFILSGLEAQFISNLQELNKHYCNEIKQYFNSNFVTLVLTKNNEEIIINEYQISEQAMELFNNEIILPTQDATQIKVVKERDVYYKAINEYNIATKVKANPFLPVEYFIVKLTHGFRHDPIFTATGYFDWRYSLKKMGKYFDGDFSIEKFSNLNLLIKIKMENLLGNKIDLLIEAIKEAYRKTSHKKLEDDKTVNSGNIDVNNNGDKNYVSSNKNSNVISNVNGNISSNLKNVSENVNNKNISNMEQCIDKFSSFLLTDEFRCFKELMNSFMQKEWICAACTFINTCINENCEMCGMTRV
ncbi:nuclear protein localization protein 4 [Conglomerata obtusa]